MSQVASYLNFTSSTEEAFQFYKSVFNPAYELQIMRYGDVPDDGSGQQLPEEVKNLVMHTMLPIFDNSHILMGSDVPAFTGTSVMNGNSINIMLMPDTRDEADRLFAALSYGGEVEQAMQDMFWGDYYGAFSDKFGIHWMINVAGH
jgi:PhnB protein